MTTTTVATDTTDIRALSTASLTRTKTTGPVHQDGTLIDIGGGVYLTAGHVMFQFVSPDAVRTAESYTFHVGEGLDTGLGGLRKHDLLRQTTESHHQGVHRSFMEPVFVPRSSQSGEDDGWILAYVYDQSTDRSDVTILDAADFSAAPVATVHLPRRVPFGFHGNWCAD